MDENGSDVALAEACLAWQGGRDTGSTPIRGAARVLTGIPHYFDADFIRQQEDAARADANVQAYASTLLHAISAARPATADEWNQSLGLYPRGFAGRGLEPKQQYDDRILEALDSGRLAMPLWGVSLNWYAAWWFGTAGKHLKPRFMLAIDGAFPAVPAWTHSGIKAAEEELICGGEYTVVNVEEKAGPVTVVTLRYHAPVAVRNAHPNHSMVHGTLAAVTENAAEFQPAYDNIADALLRCWQSTAKPWESGGSFHLPNGGYVQWTRVDEPGSDVHIEVNEGGDYADPMPSRVATELERIGWAPPNDTFRNCWMRVGRPDGDTSTGSRSWFLAAADRVLSARMLLADLLVRSADGTELRSPGRVVRNTPGGGLQISGQDFGSAVGEFWGAGSSEYEFVRTLDAAAVDRLRTAAGIGDHPLLDGIAARFASTADLERFLRDHGIESQFWSRVGD